MDIKGVINRLSFKTLIDRQITELLTGDFGAVLETAADINEFNDMIESRLRMPFNLIWRMVDDKDKEELYESFKKQHKSFSLNINNLEGINNVLFNS